MRFDNGDTALVVFSFSSTMSADLPAAAMHRICREARKYNASHGLTGTLSIEGGSVRQVIEGPWSVVMPLAARILTDPRHGGIAITAFEPVACRAYSDWSSTGADLEPMGAPVAGNLHLLPFVRRQVPAAGVAVAASGAATGAS